MPARAAIPRCQPSNFTQILVDELHGYRPLTYSGGHALHRAVSHVAHREYTGNVRLE